MEEITNWESYLDSRDIEERIRDLKEFQEDQVIEDEEIQELENLENLREQGICSPDWEYGATLIRDSIFEDYAREFAEEIGAIDSEAVWPNNHIDWEAASEELKMDYSEIDFDGVIYWIR